MHRRLVVFVLLAGLVLVSAGYATNYVVSLVVPARTMTAVAPRQTCTTRWFQVCTTPAQTVTATFPETTVTGTVADPPTVPETTTDTTTTEETTTISTTTDTTPTTTTTTTTTPPPPNGSANLWVDTSGGSCVRSVTPTGYSDAAACSSFDAAYQKAVPGDRVNVKGGTYGAQTLNDRTGIPLGSEKVEFHPAPGENVTITQEFNIKTHDVLVDGGDTANTNEVNRISVYGDQDGSDQAADFGWGNNSPRVVGNVMEDLHVRNAYFDDDSSGNNFRYSEVGPSTYGGINVCSDLVQSGDAQFVVEYNIVHDNSGSGCGGAHIDAFDLNPASAPQSVVRGNRIWYCGTQCIFSGDPGSVLVENNFIEETNACGSGCDGPQEIALMGDTVVRYNTVEGDVGLSCDSCSPQRPGDADVYGNVFLSSRGCSTVSNSNTTIRCDHNVFPPGISGGTNSRSCTPLLADGNAWTNTDRQADFHLSPFDTCAVDFGDAARNPGVDIDQQERLDTPDAGADEVS